MLTSSDTAALDAYAQAFAAAGSSDPITVSGYASVDGQDAHNQKLSQDRADAVVGYLQGRGLSSLISGSGFGETSQFSGGGDVRKDRCVVLQPKPPTPGKASPQVPSPQPQGTPSPAVPGTPSPQVPGTPSPKVPATPSPTPSPLPLGFPLNVVIPVEWEVPAWNGKIKLKLKGKITFEAVIGGPKFPVTFVLTADGAKALGLKASHTWWTGKGQIAVGGVAIFEKPAISTKAEANKKDGVVVKAETTVDTPIGQLALTGTVLQWKPGAGLTYGTVAGGLKGYKIPIPAFDVESVKVHDIFISSEIAAEIAPQYLKIVADEIWDGMKSAFEGVAIEVTVDAVVVGALIIGGVATIFGAVYSIVQAWGIGDLAQGYKPALDDTKAGFRAAMTGGGAPGSNYGKAGYDAGMKNFQAVFAQAKQANPNATDDVVRQAIALKADDALAQAAASIESGVRTGLWDGYLAQHTTLLLGNDAKWAFVACFGDFPRDGDKNWQKYVDQHPTQSKM